jgi:hypothetical protein
MELKVPSPLKLEHEELHNLLRAAIRFKDETGRAALRVERLMQNHFAKEEEFALPPLGLLQSLASGALPPEDAAGAMRMADRLRVELPDMLAEHRAMVAALELLMRAAGNDNHPELIDFAERMMLHNQCAEQVTYPTALLIGEFLKLKRRIQQPLATNTHG